MDRVTLTDEFGKEIEFEHLGSVEVDGTVYIGLVEIMDDKSKQSEDYDSFIILKTIEDDGGEEFFATISDEEELKRASDAFNEYFDEYEIND